MRRCIFICFTSRTTNEFTLRRCALNMAKSPATRSSKGTNTRRGKIRRVCERGTRSTLPYTTEKEKALTIDAFISPSELDPIYFDGRMYYLIPSGASASEPYTLIESAMEKKKRWGIGQVVFSGREQLALVRPLEGVLTMAMLKKL